jgi:hypothetical protein
VDDVVATIAMRMVRNGDLHLTAHHRFWAARDLWWRRPGDAGYKPDLAADKSGLIARYLNAAKSKRLQPVRLYQTPELRYANSAGGGGTESQKGPSKRPLVQLAFLRDLLTAAWLPRIIQPASDAVPTS